jgi:cell division septum initiation protein DivIVA
MAPPHDRDQTEALPFTVSRHGYDREQVRQHLLRVGDETKRAQTERDQLREQNAELNGQLQIARREIAALTQRLETMAAEQFPQSVQQERAARTLQQAEAQASEIVQRAQAAADHTWAKAEEASATLRERYQRLLADLARQHDELHSEHEQIMRSARGQVEEMTTAAQAQRRRIDEQAQAERDRIEREFQASIGSRRAKLDAELAERKAEAEEQAQQLIRGAVHHANEQIAKANKQLAEIARRRKAAAKHLSGATTVLDQSAGLLEPVDEEADLTTLEGGDKPVAPELREPQPTNPR